MLGWEFNLKSLLTLLFIDIDELTRLQLLLTATWLLSAISLCSGQDGQYPAQGFKAQEEKIDCVYSARSQWINKSEDCYVQRNSLTSRLLVEERFSIVKETFDHERDWNERIFLEPQTNLISVLNLLKQKWEEMLCFILEVSSFRNCRQRGRARTINKWLV